MIFAAGLGTRLKPFTDTKPKALLEIGGKTFLENVICRLKSYGITEVVVNVHHLAEQIIEYLKKNNNFGTTIHISDERNALLDTGGGLLKAEPFLTGSEPVVIYNVDILSNVDLHEVIDYHNSEKALATIVVRKRKTQRYLLFNSEVRLIGWKNIQTGETKISVPEDIDEATPLAFSGIHVINPEIFNLMEKEGKFSLIDTYLDLAKSHNIKGFLHNSGYWLDIGKPDQLEKARKVFNKL